MHILIIEHVPDSDPPLFRVQRHDPLAIAPDTATVAPPVGFPVEGAQVLEGLLEGLTYRQIADRLGVGYGTVSGHVKKIYKTHGVHGREELAARATCSCPTNQPSQPAE